MKPIITGLPGIGHNSEGYTQSSGRDANTNSPFLTTGEAAEFLRLSVVTLGRWRVEGVGPRYRKFGRKVVYGQADLIAWADAQTHLSTSEEA